ncbi:MAG TPA: hypothetical protein VHM70_20170 [Polyangiaceae bacterium]|jgi:hypothetical protein|nr:hypothetical protein [Polyangiaceae bacterium]
MSDVITQIQNAEAAKLKALSKLHAELGYPSAQALAEAILGAAGSTKTVASRVAAQPAASKPAVSAKATKVAVALGKGRRVPDSVRAEIAAALKAGETASKLPKKFGVSYNIIHEVKKKIGMVSARS